MKIPKLRSMKRANYRLGPQIANALKPFSKNAGILTHQDKDPQEALVDPHKAEACNFASTKCLACSDATPSDTSGA
jgi:hypothetical protein